MLNILKLLNSAFVEWKELQDIFKGFVSINFSFIIIFLREKGIYFFKKIRFLGGK
jgi:hypothetical protein